MSRVLFLGARDEVRGFALAGVPGRTAPDARALEAALEEAAREGIGLILVSPVVAALAPRAIEALADRLPPPAVLVLPGGGA